MLPLLLGRPAAAADEVHALGRVVAQVSLEAPEGGLPRESLEPLLRVQQGARLELADVRQDIAILYRVGLFASVEAIVEPWLVFEGEEAADAVRVVYRVVPAPRVGALEIEGVRGPAKAIAERASALYRGQAFFPEEEAAALVERVTGALVAAGWPRARARYSHTVDDDGALALRLRVRPGPAHRYGEIGLAGDEVVPERRIRRWMRARGVSRGRRIDEPALASAREAVRDRLHEEGWLEAVINVLRVPTDPTGATEDLRVVVDAGPRVQAHASGRGLPPTTTLREILGLVPGARPGQESLDELEARLESWYRARGWFEAAVRIRREVEEDAVHLNVEARRGRRHVLGRIEVEGASAFSPRYLAGALKEAAPETLGKGIVTRESVEAGLETVREFYRSQGFLDARLDLAGIEVGRASLSGVPLHLRVRVREGPRTRLGSLEALGGVLDPETGSPLEAAVLARARDALQGQPYNPAAIEALALEITELYQSRGYLSADVRAATTLTPIDETSAEAAARLLVTPGEELRLRSVAIQGNRRTQRHVIARELRGALGAPITPEQMEESRSALYALDLFRSVSLGLVGDDDRSRDLVVSVEEKPNILLEVGGGVSTDEGVAARVRASHRNLAGLGQRLSALGQVGFGWVGDGWTLDGAAPVWRAALRYEAPYVPARGYRLIAELLLNEAVQEPFWRLSRSGASLGVSARWGPRLEAFLDYHYQARRLEDADPGVLVEGEPWWPLLEDRPDTPSAYRLQGGTGLTLVYDARDEPLNPSRGTLLTAAVELGDPLSADPAFMRSTGLVEHLLPLGPLRLDLRARGGLGVVEGQHTTLAVEDRFTLGGSGSLRGFRQDTVGPANLSLRPDIDYPDGIGPVIDATALTAEPTHWVNTGGDTMAALTAELVVPLSAVGLDFDSTSLVLFADAGTVGFLDRRIITTSRSDALEDPDWRVGVGLGLHIATPIGPAALDLGLNLDPLDERDEPLFVPHLSLGAL